MMRGYSAAMAWFTVAFLWSAAAAAATYSADPQQSRLEFVGVQAGAEFKGVFHKFTVGVDFAPDALASAHFDVQIDMNSVDSMDKDRDTTIRGPDVFDVAHWPTAHYVTRSFTKTATGYAAVGALTMRGVTKDVPIDIHADRLGRETRRNRQAQAPGFRRRARRLEEHRVGGRRSEDQLLAGAEA
jgi:polyisoprenoid-binding protein YceI